VSHALVLLLLLQAVSQPVAIVSSIEGSAWIQPKTGPRRPLALYDWVSADAVVEVGDIGRLELIMIDGRRYRLNGGAGAMLSATSLSPLRGSVTQESAMPKLVALAPIAGNAPRAAGAVRIRGRTIVNMNPCDAVRTLRDETVLRFNPVDGASRYAIEVRTAADEQVFARTVTEPRLAVPAGTLAAGTDYFWVVRTEGVDPPAQSESRFTTLDSAAETARRAFASALEPAAGGLLGGIDVHLGLLNEAVAELTAAAQRAPRDAAVGEAAKRARAALAATCSAVR
jgi:hypothetical protein